MRRGGFASFSAVIMLAIVASAMTAGAAFVTLQWRRSQHADRDAQLRQFLLAGEVYAARALGDGAAELDAELPEGGWLRIERLEPLRVRVTATHRSRQVSQVLTYERAGGALRLRDAEVTGIAALQ